MGYYSIGQKLKTVLDTVKNAVGSGLAAVYEYDIQTSDEKPFACIITSGATEEMLDTQTNQTVYNYKIRVIDTDKNKSTLENNMRQLCDDILAELRKEANETLQGEAVRFLPFTVEWTWSGSQDTFSRIFEINIEIVELFDI